MGTIHGMDVNIPKNVRQHVLKRLNWKKKELYHRCTIQSMDPWVQTSQPTNLMPLFDSTYKKMSADQCLQMRLQHLKGILKDPFTALQYVSLCMLSHVLMCVTLKKPIHLNAPQKVHKPFLECTTMHCCMLSCIAHLSTR